jgi:hypothetical protein
MTAVMILIFNNKTQIMKFINIPIKAFLFFTFISLLASCSKVDTETIEDAINQETEIVDCSGTLKVTINGDLDIINHPGRAIIFTDACQVSYPLVIMVTKEDYDFGGNPPNTHPISNGMPGFAFVADTNTMAGDELTHTKNTTAAGTRFSNGLNEHFYGFEKNVDFTITKFGTEIGDTIAAVIEGNFIELNDTIPFKAEFCVPVTYICQ